MLTGLPNLLTLGRIAAVPLVVILAGVGAPGTDAAAAAVFALASVTDWLDGYLARSRGQTSEFGRMLDPIADKLLVGATLLMLAGTHRLDGWGLYPAVIVLAREILVSGLREYMAGSRAGLPVTTLAKWKTGAQMAALGTLLLGNRGAAWLGLAFLPATPIGLALIVVAALLTVATGWVYLSQGLRHAARAPAAVRGSPGRAPG